MNRNKIILGLIGLAFYIAVPTQAFAAAARPGTCHADVIHLNGTFETNQTVACDTSQPPVTCIKEVSNSHDGGFVPVDYEQNCHALADQAEAQLLKPQADQAAQKQP